MDILFIIIIVLVILNICSLILNIIFFYTIILNYNDIEEKYYKK